MIRFVQVLIRALGTAVKGATVQAKKCICLRLSVNLDLPVLSMK